MSNDLGLSGCKLELLSDSTIRKYSSNENYNHRLAIQIDKQNLFSKYIFTNIDTPKIIQKYEDKLIYFDMEYIMGCDYYEYFSSTSSTGIQKIFNFLDEYFEFLIYNSRQYKEEVVKDKIKNKLLSFKNEQHTSLIKFVLNYLTDINLDVKKSFCHGDLTVSNILFHPKKIYLIDFLDSYLDTFLLDLVKLKQDLHYHWILEINKSKNLRIVQCFNIVWNYIETKYAKYLNTDTFYILELINFLRIEPYLTNSNQRIILNNIIKKTFLYGEFARSHGREIHKIS
jgi:serine/threonine protein kinase